MKPKKSRRGGGRQNTPIVNGNDGNSAWRHCGDPLTGRIWVVEVDSDPECVVSYFDQWMRYGSGDDDLGTQCRCGAQKGTGAVAVLRDHQNNRRHPEMMTASH